MSRSLQMKMEENERLTYVLRLRVNFSYNLFIFRFIQ